MSLPNDIWTRVLEYTITSIDDVVKLQTINKWFFAASRIYGNIDLIPRHIKMLDKITLKLASQLYNLGKISTQSELFVPRSARFLRILGLVTPLDLSHSRTMHTLYLLGCAVPTRIPTGLKRLFIDSVFGGDTHHLITSSLTRLDMRHMPAINLTPLTHLSHLALIGSNAKAPNLVQITQLTQLHTLIIPDYCMPIDITNWALTRLDIGAALPNATLMSLTNLRDLTVEGPSYAMTTVDKLSLVTLRLINTDLEYTQLMLPTLQNIYVRRSYMTMEHVTRLSVVFSNYRPILSKQLQSLKLQFVRDHAYDADDIINASSLTYLDIRRSSCLLNDDAIVKIRNARPQLYIREHD
mgnify:FL=1